MKLTNYRNPLETQWPALSGLNRLNQLLEMDWPFNGFGLNESTHAGWAPALDIYEGKENLEVRVEVPGLKREDIDVKIHNGMLTVSGERRTEKKAGEEGELHRSERYYGRFQRSVTLPVPVQVDQIKASYRDGILEITLPKAEEARAKQIEVSVD